MSHSLRLFGDLWCVTTILAKTAVPWIFFSPCPKNFQIFPTSPDPVRMSSQALMVISQFICFHSFTDLSIKWFNETLDIPTGENKNYFNSDNSPKIIWGIKNYDSVTFLFVPNKIDRTSMLANDRQRWHQKAPPPEKRLYYLILPRAFSFQ